MKTIFLKIIALSFLTILLTSNVLNLHVYLHEEDSQQLTEACQNDSDEQGDPCDLCLLALHLNDLDYNNTLEFSYENHIQTTNYNGKEVLAYQQLYYDQLFSDHNRNKAPPHLI